MLPAACHAHNVSTWPSLLTIAAGWAGRQQLTLSSDLAQYWEYRHLVLHLDHEPSQFSYRILQGGPGGTSAPGPGDLARYWEYCHLVPAKGLRTAYDSLLDGR